MGNNTFRGGLYALLVLVCVWASTAQVFNLTFRLPITALPPPILKSGSLGANFSGADDSGGATLDILNRDDLIDRAVAMELFSGSFSCGGAGCNGSIAPVSAGTVSDPGGVNADIGINLVLSLTAGNYATYDTRFEVPPVPVPGAVWLFGSCLIGLAGVARRLKTIH